MKRKLMVIVLLVAVSLSVLVVKGVTQTPLQPSGDYGTRPASLTPSAAPPTPLTLGSEPTPVLSSVQQQQDLSFEQLVESLKVIRARQKELQTQEADLLAKMAKKVEEKRKDLHYYETALQQLRGDALDAEAQRLGRGNVTEPAISQPSPSGKEPAVRAP
jgi:hypothetical protein